MVWFRSEKLNQTKSLFHILCQKLMVSFENDSEFTVIQYYSTQFEISQHFLTLFNLFKDILFIFEMNWKL